MKYLIVAALLFRSDTAIASGNEAIPAILAVIGSEILPALLIMGARIFAGRRLSFLILYVLTVVCSWTALIAITPPHSLIVSGPISEIFTIFGTLVAIPWIAFLVLATFCARAKSKERKQLRGKN